ncbi:macrophage colony-stimulating factor 1a isoform X2 [Electrophorus electricus]|uniref:macrophage colony-stimulating factor 1a isoform X2 n=1 Tax=Electrophorus electricus TaxID=8005 RepID=UPI0015CFE22B|nr:macrophage colony-stimulating factor 1a isoform X2 [Electrophorus electricus]
MNTHTTAHKAKIRRLCFLLALCLPWACGEVPGPCKHSVTEDHLLTLRRLIGNQLQNGCSITYSFTERQNLSEACFIKAAFPHILELLNTHLRYGRESDNYRYTNLLKNLIYNIYSQKCIPQINEEIENDPVRFARVHTTLPSVGLEKAEQVIKMYKNLVAKNDSPVEWNCGDEYADYPEPTTAFSTQRSDLLPLQQQLYLHRGPHWYLRGGATQEDLVHLNLWSDTVHQIYLRTIVHLLLQILIRPM